MSRRLLILVGVALLVAVFSYPARPAFAASVVVPINVTVAEAGAPSFTWAIDGSCSPSPSSGLTGGIVGVTMTNNCAYTINTPPDGTTQRNRLTNGATYVTSLSMTSCSSGTCTTVADTAHDQELLTISTSCNTPAVSVASPSNDRWYNYGTPLAVTCNGTWSRSGGTGTRAASWNWDGGSNSNVATTSTFTSSSQTMNAGHALNVNTVTQYQLTLDSGALSALSIVTGPTITSDFYWYDSGTAVTYSGNGVFGRASGTGTRSVSWALDAGGATTLSTSGVFSVPASMTSAHTIHVTTRAQYQVTLDAGTSSMLNSITSPTLTNDKYWYDSGTAVTLVLNGIGTRSGGTGTRLVSYAVNGGTIVTVATTGKVTVLNALVIGATQSVAGSLATQYQLALDSGTTGALAGITSPSIQGDNYWYDSGTQVTYSGNGVFGRASGVGLRVVAWWWDSNPGNPLLTSGTFPTIVTMNVPHTLHTSTVPQYQLELTGAYAVSSATQPTIAGDDYWYDSGTVVSLSLDGVFGRMSGTGERTTSYSVNGGPTIDTGTAGPVTVMSSVALTAPQTISVEAVKQYQLTLDATTNEASYSISAPSLVADNYWYDTGSRVTVVANGVWNRTSTTGYRLSSYSVNGAGPTSVASSGNVVLLDVASISGPQSITSTKVTQYLLAVNGGSGVTYSVNPPIERDTGWYDSGTTLKVLTNGTYNSDGSTRQRIVSLSMDNGIAAPAGATTIVTTSEIVMYAAHSVNFYSVTQYHVLFAIKDNSDVTTLTPDSIQLTVNGGNQTAVGSAVWSDSGATVSVVGVFWHGSNVAPAQPTRYTVLSPMTITINARVFDATIAVTDALGLPVGGANAVISLANGTVVHTSTNGDGTISLRMIPLGTYQGTIGNLGFSSAFSAHASVNKTTEVRISLSYPVIIAIVAVIAAIVIGVLIITRRRR